MLFFPNVLANFFTVTGEEESHLQNHYQEFETELNHTPQSVFSQRERVLECEGLPQSYTPTLQRLLKRNQTKSQIFKEETEVKPKKDIQTDSVSDNTRLRAGWLLD